MTSQVQDRLYIVVDNSLPTGLAAAQIAHAAARAAFHPNFPEIKDETYIIVLACPEDPDIYADRLAHWCHPDYAIGDEPTEHIILWHEPDLGDRCTAAAVLNPKPGVLSSLRLWEGGEQNGS